MTDKEKLTHAKMCIDQLANGINPIGGSPIPSEDIFNNPQFSRCFAFVSDILQVELDRDEQKRKNQQRKSNNKSQLSSINVTPEITEQFQYSKAPISASAIVRKINFLI